uniref:Uncharacterized protein n=1 Tax=Amphora coffeiformis TaxID=265554 RepID=A0A7S3L7V2_9STRA|eukprot:scaffold10022_cov170-Amphora_coffeaeformis.AAC.5
MQTALKSMQRMCSTQILSSNRSVTVSSGPATEALKRASRNEALKRATKRRRMEDPATLECTKVTKEFDMAAVFAELPTNEESFPSICWEFDDVFGADPFSSVLPSPRPLSGGTISPLHPSSSKRLRTDSSSSLVRSKTTNSFESIVNFPDICPAFDLDSEVLLARDLGEAVLNRSFGSKHHTLDSKLNTLLFNSSVKS